MPASHILQPRHIKLNQEEKKKLLLKYNISSSQLPKIRVSDPALPEGCAPGDVVKIERKEGEKIQTYYRVVVA
ncbi:DNA-directed RNA polymerase subunit H [Candidatus Pacearchaeota archaeon]|nr:DNA-directed RNA polymerase subunit H [Candidatus Pacearchaeota archaeon]